MTDIKTETVEKVEYGLKLILKNAAEDYGIEIPSLEIDRDCTRILCLIVKKFPEFSIKLSLEKINYLEILSEKSFYYHSYIEI